MVRPNPVPNPSRSPVKRDGNSPQDLIFISRQQVDIQKALDRLEEIILDCPRVPWMKKTMINEDELLDQLDIIRVSLPDAFQKAIEIIRQKDDILAEAERYASAVIETAEQEATGILNDLGIRQKAEAEANQLKERVQRECETMRQQAILDIEQMRRSAQQQLDSLRQLTLSECQEVQYGADEYADKVLNRLEDQLQDILRVVKNGRSQLHVDLKRSAIPTPNTNTNTTPIASLPSLAPSSIAPNASREVTNLPSPVQAPPPPLTPKVTSILPESIKQSKNREKNDR